MIKKKNQKKRLKEKELIHVFFPASKCYDYSGKKDNDSELKTKCCTISPALFPVLYGHGRQVDFLPFPPVDIHGRVGRTSIKHDAVLENKKKRKK
jgi:hypothetical protein